MNTQDPAQRVRPIFVVVLACVIAAIAVPIWLHKPMLARVPDVDRPAARTREAPAPIPTTEAEASAPTATGAPIVAQRSTRLSWRPAVTRKAKALKAVAALPPAPPARPVNPGASLEKRWGIRVCGARLSMGNAFLDLRYQVVNAEKAALLAIGTLRAYLYEPATGATLYLPDPPKEGSFPPVGNRLADGRTYFAVVGNARGVLKSGSKVELVIGDVRTPELVVE